MTADVLLDKLDAGARGDAMNTTGAVEQYVWMRCAEGGQIIGNLQEIRPFDKSTYDLACSSFQSGGITYEQLSSGPSQLYASIISKDNGKTWKLVKLLDNIDDLRPAEYKFNLGWVKQVDEFSSAEAQEHIRIADSGAESTETKSYCRQIKAALSAQFGPGWSVTRQDAPGSVSIFIAGPKAADGYRYIADDLARLELNRMLGRDGSCPRGGIFISATDVKEIERFMAGLTEAPAP